MSGRWWYVVVPTDGDIGNERIGPEREYKTLYREASREAAAVHLEGELEPRNEGRRHPYPYPSRWEADEEGRMVCASRRLYQPETTIVLSTPKR